MFLNKLYFTIEKYELKHHRDMTQFYLRVQWVISELFCASFSRRLFMSCEYEFDLHQNERV